MNPRLLRTIADVMLATLVLVIGFLLYGSHDFMVKCLAHGLILIAFVILTEERAEWHRSKTRIIEGECEIEYRGIVHRGHAVVEIEEDI